MNYATIRLKFIMLNGGIRHAIGSIVKCNDRLFLLSVIHALGFGVLPSNVERLVKFAETTINGVSYRGELANNIALPAMVQNDDTWDTTGDFITFEIKDKVAVAELDASNSVIHVHDSDSPVGTAVFLPDMNAPNTYHTGHIENYFTGFMRVKMDKHLNLNFYSGSPILDANKKMVGLLSGGGIINIGGKNDLYLDCLSVNMLRSYYNILSNK